MKTITIGILEDHKLVREMWSSLFHDITVMEVVGQGANLQEALEMIREKKPDVLLLDINLPGTSGMEAAPLILQLAPATRIIAVSMHNQPAYAQKMIRAGAKGYVTKNSSPQEMLEAIRQVMAGKQYICQEIKEAFTGEMLTGDSQKGDIRELTVREIEIIKCIKEGLTSKEIADRLQISVRTVEVHRRNILQKLKLNNSASLINFIHGTDLSFL
jgi:two-component system invasion response regulator UvrY